MKFREPTFESSGLLYGSMIFSGLTLGFLINFIFGLAGYALPLLLGGVGFFIAQKIDRKQGLTARELSAECDPLDPWKRSDEEPEDEGPHNP